MCSVREAFNKARCVQVGALHSPADALDLKRADSAPCLLKRVKAFGRVGEVPRVPFARSALAVALAEVLL
jgi:hypothetical protein